MVTATRSRSSEIVGSVEPRVWTRPLRELSPETSYGYDVIDFAEEIGRPLDPWQRWVVIHAGELQENGLPRFRQVLVLVARQNGKTELLVVLALFWMYIEGVRLVLGTSTNLDYARESWEKAVTRAEANPRLDREIMPKNGVRRANGEQTLTLLGGGRYKIAASTRKGGRSLTVDRLIMDELREHHDWSAYSAAVPAMAAVPDAQVWMITNAGDDKSVVLNSLRDQAMAGEDPRLGIFEWSAPDGVEATDIDGLAQANPNLGRRISLDALMGDAVRAQSAGGEQLASFLTENQCRHVTRLNPAIDIASWDACKDPGSLEGERNKLAACLDISVDGQHATLYAAAQLEDGRVRVDPIHAWTGRDAATQVKQELDGLLATVKPRVFGWFPAGPSAVLAAEFEERPEWPPEALIVQEIRGTDVSSVCMGFAAEIVALQVAHSDDPLLNAHVAGAEKLAQGDSWRYTRRGASHVDALYAAAGAAYLARLLANGALGEDEELMSERGFLSL